MADASNLITSLGGARQTLENATKSHEPPANCILKTDEEVAFWRELMRSKPYDRWTPATLSMAYQVIRMEMRIRRGNARLDELIEQGADLFHPDSIATEYAANISKAQRQQLSILRALGLTFTAVTSASTTARAAQKEQHAIDAFNDIDGKGTRLPGFMAVPN